MICIPSTKNSANFVNKRYGLTPWLPQLTTVNLDYKLLAYESDYIIIIRIVNTTRSILVRENVRDCVQKLYTKPKIYDKYDIIICPTTQSKKDLN